MLYNPPSGSTDSNASYVGKDVAAGRQGSRLPPTVPEGTQREIVAIIAAAQAMGMPAPTNSDLAQMLKAIRSGLLNRYVGTGSTDAITIAPQPAYITLLEGMRFRIKLPGSGSNTTADVLLTISGLQPIAVLKRDGTKPAIGDLTGGAVVEFEIDAAGKARLVSAVASDAASTSAVTLISQALQSNIKTTVFSNATTTNLTNGAATAVVFADNSKPEITNNGAGTFTCYAPGAYLINFNTSIGTVLSSGGSNDVFARILINGVSTGFNKSPYYAPGAATFFQFVSVNLQSAVVRLGTGDTIQMAAGVTVPSGFSSAYSQGHVASFTRLF
jgi:hypothetical protein